MPSTAGQESAVCLCSSEQPSENLHKLNILRTVISMKCSLSCSTKNNVGGAVCLNEQTQILWRYSTHAGRLNTSNKHDKVETDHQLFTPLQLLLQHWVMRLGSAEALQVQHLPGA